MSKLDGYFDNVYHRNSKLYIKISKCNEDILRKRIKKINKSENLNRFSEILIISLLSGVESVRNYSEFKKLYNFETDNETIMELRGIKHKVYLELKIRN